MATPECVVVAPAKEAGVPFFALFRFASSAEKALMSLGICLQLVVGTSMSAMNIVFA